MTTPYVLCAGTCGNAAPRNESIALLCAFMCAGVHVPSVKQALMLGVSTYYSVYLRCASITVATITTTVCWRVWVLLAGACGTVPWPLCIFMWCLFVGKGTDLAYTLYTPPTCCTHYLCLYALCCTQPAQGAADCSAVLWCACEGLAVAQATQHWMDACGSLLVI